MMISDPRGFVAAAESAGRMRAAEDQRCAPAALSRLDPALLALVKCHITSVARWDVLWALSERVGAWTDPAQLARELRRSRQEVDGVMGDLHREGVLEAVGPPEKRSYRLADDEPTSVAVARLYVEATRSPELREIIVAHLLRAAVGRSS